MSGGLLTKLAATTAETLIRHGQIIAPPEHLGPLLATQSACYVTILENPGRMFRAQYGTTMPRKNTLAEEIINNTVLAVESAYNPLRPIDVGYLMYRIAVLSAMERISQPEHITPGVHGLLIRSDKGKSAVILPGRVGIDTADEQIATAYREAGINARSEFATLYRFNVVTYE